MHNLILHTDSYKISHWPQYPPGTTGVYSYFTPRGGLFPEATFFGLQEKLADYLSVPVSYRDIKEAEDLITPHMGPLLNKAGWEHVVREHKGYLPLRVMAVPEGTTVQVRNVFMTVENTCPQCYWLTNYMETLLVQTWYPTTVCTLSREIKKTIKKYLELTGPDTSGLEFKLHDFGFRGVSSPESAGIGGAAHLVNFRGTDTLLALLVARDIYNAQDIAGFSIPAAEHSTITSWGPENEQAAYENMLTQYPNGLVAVVSDSYDIFQACERLWGGTLKDKVLSRPGTLVIRPDSGDPVKTVVKVMEILSAQFGYEVTQNGYRLLPKQVRVIQGDGINYESIGQILASLAGHGFAADNLAFGMGGALLQRLDRDTLGHAFKCAAIRDKEGKWQPVYKKPVTDPFKASRAGRMMLVKTDAGYETVDEDPKQENQLVTFFENGRIRWDNWQNIRERAAL